MPTPNELAAMLCAATLAAACHPKQASDVITLANGIEASTTFRIRGRMTSRGDLPDRCGLDMSIDDIEYQVLATLDGVYSGRRLHALVGCGGMPREMFSKDAGTLKAFVTGEIHELTLTSIMPNWGHASYLSLDTSEGVPHFWANHIHLAVPRKHRSSDTLADE